ncbi:MAG: RNase H family protein [Pirellulales bacterium]
MNSANPGVVLVTHARSYAASGGQWHFELRSAAGEVLLSATDREAETIGPRLELLAAVRGLEALDAPSDVTLLTASRYVRRGIVYGLDHWRQTGWTWEWFGHMVPVRNHDLWQRVARTLEFHSVQCLQVRFDAPHASGAEPYAARRARRERFRRSREFAHAHTSHDELLPDELVAAASSLANSDDPPAPVVEAPPKDRRSTARRLRWQRWFADQQESVLTRLSQLGTGYLPRPWLE